MTRNTIFTVHLLHTQTLAHIMWGQSLSSMPTAINEPKLQNSWTGNVNRWPNSTQWHSKLWQMYLESSRLCVPYAINCLMWLARFGYKLEFECTQSSQILKLHVRNDHAIVSIRAQPRSKSPLSFLEHVANFEIASNWRRNRVLFCSHLFCRSLPNTQ